MTLRPHSQGGKAPNAPNCHISSFASGLGHATARADRRGKCVQAGFGADSGPSPWQSCHIGGLDRRQRPSYGDRHRLPRGNGRHDLIDYQFARRPSSLAILRPGLGASHPGRQCVPRHLRQHARLFGGRSGAYENVLRDAREHAIADMVKQAEALGANAIVGIEIDYSAVGSKGSMLMVSANCTAVKLG